MKRPRQLMCRRAIRSMRVLALLVLPLVAASAMAEPARLAGAVYRKNTLDEELSDLFLVELSKQRGIELVERRQLQLILTLLKFHLVQPVSLLV